MLTDLESVFRSLKSELGMRPVYHHKEDRCDGHLFITVLSYQAVQVSRRKLKDHGINESWTTLREKACPTGVSYSETIDRKIARGDLGRTAKGDHRSSSDFQGKRTFTGI